MHYKIILVLSGLLFNSFVSIGSGSNGLRLDRDITDSDKSSKKYQPDTSVNKTIYLCNPSSITIIFGDLMSQINKNADLPDITFLNQKGNQYLKMLFHPGDIKNSFSEFEIGYATDSLTNKSTKSNFISFETENGIKLGITKQELIKEKGIGYTSSMKAHVTCVRYFIGNFSKSSFLNRYNMPIYYSEYYLKDDKVVKFRFGFEYP